MLLSYGAGTCGSIPNGVTFLITTSRMTFANKFLIILIVPIFISLYNFWIFFQFIL